jgi:Karyopherin (importin) alpha
VEEADGLDKLEDLETHANDAIYRKAVELLETYFSAEDEMDAEGTGMIFEPPASAAQGFNFNFPASK